MSDVTYLINKLCFLGRTIGNQMSANIVIFASAGLVTIKR